MTNIKKNELGGMINFFLLTYLLIFSCETKSQKIVNTSRVNKAANEIIFDCLRQLPNASCNYILNPEFVSSSTTNIAPFYDGSVANWADSHGTADINSPGISLTPPFQGINFASIYAFTDAGQSMGEGICSKIKPLQQGNKYSMSFFRNITKYNTNYSNISVKFRVVLIKCNNFSGAGIDYGLPSIPTNYQTIFCENNISSAKPWEQAYITFQANDNYDMIWVFPELESPTNNFSFIASYGLHFAYPELVDVSNFSASASSNGIGCNYILEANQACVVRNLEFHWTDPLGNSIGNTQQVLTTNTNMHGAYHVSMDIPNSIQPNCISTLNPLSANISLPNCSNSLEIINATATYLRTKPTNQNINWYTQSLDYNTDNPICYNGEEYIGIEASSNISTGNSWQFFTSNPNITINNGGGITNPFAQTLVASLGFNSMSEGVSMSGIVEFRLTNSVVNEVKSLFIKVTGGFHDRPYTFAWCNSSNPSFDGKIVGGEFNDPTYSYSWSFPLGMVVSNSNLANPSFSLGTYSGVYPANATVFVTNTYCPNDYFTSVVPITPGSASCFARMSNPTPNYNNLNAHKYRETIFGNVKTTSTIYPNPTSGLFKVKSTKLIKDILVTSVDGRIFKKIESTDKEKINIRELNSGTYLIVMHYSDGTKESKLIIKQ